MLTMGEVCYNLSIIKYFINEGVAHQIQFYLNAAKQCFFRKAVSTETINQKEQLKESLLYGQEALLRNMGKE